MNAAVMGIEMKPTIVERLTKVEADRDNDRNRLNKIEEMIEKKFDSIDGKLNFMMENWNKGKGAAWASRIIIMGLVSAVLWISSHLLPYLPK